MSSQHPTPLGSKELAFFDYLLSRTTEPTELNKVSRFLNGLAEGGTLPSNLQLVGIRGGIRGILNWEGGSKVSEAMKQEAVKVRKWINLMVQTRVENKLEEEKLRDKWGKYGSEWMQGSPEAILDLVRQKAPYISIRGSEPESKPEPQSEPEKEVVEIPQNLTEIIRSWGLEKQKRQLEYLIKIQESKAISDDLENYLSPHIMGFIKERNRKVNNGQLELVINFVSEISGINIDNLKREIKQRPPSPKPTPATLGTSETSAHLTPPEIIIPPERDIEINQEGLVSHLQKEWKPQNGLLEAYEQFINLCIKYLGLNLPYFKDELHKGSKKRDKRVDTGIIWMKLALGYNGRNQAIIKAIKGDTLTQLIIGERVKEIFKKTA